MAKLYYIAPYAPTPTIGNDVYKGKPLTPAELDQNFANLKNAISSVANGIIFKGTWNALANEPEIPEAHPTNVNWAYKVSVAGPTVIDLNNFGWDVGDTIISDGNQWHRLPVVNTGNSSGGDPGYMWYEYGIGPTITGNFLVDGTPDEETALKIEKLESLGIPKNAIIVAIPIIVPDEIRYVFPLSMITDTTMTVARLYPSILVVPMDMYSESSLTLLDTVGILTASIMTQASLLGYCDFAPPPHMLATTMYTDTYLSACELIGDMRAEAILQTSALGNAYFGEPALLADMLTDSALEESVLTYMPPNPLLTAAMTQTSSLTTTTLNYIVPVVSLDMDQSSSLTTMFSFETVDAVLADMNQSSSLTDATVPMVGAISLMNMDQSSSLTTMFSFETVDAVLADMNQSSSLTLSELQFGLPPTGTIEFSYFTIVGDDFLLSNMYQDSSLDLATISQHMGSLGAYNMTQGSSMTSATLPLAGASVNTGQGWSETLPFTVVADGGGESSVQGYSEAYLDLSAGTISVVYSVEYYDDTDYFGGVNILIGDTNVTPSMDVVLSETAEGGTVNYSNTSYIGNHWVRVVILSDCFDPGGTNSTTLESVSVPVN